MSKEYDINSVTDLLEIPPDKIDGVLLDMKSWYLFALDLKENAPEGANIQHEGFIWVDDDIRGISDVIINGESYKENAQ